MPFREAIRLAVQVIWSHKMKSAFAVVGVFIGVTFLIAVVTVVEGINLYMTENVAGNFLGVNTFQLRRYPDFTVGDTPRETWREWRRRPRISYDDARAVTAAITAPVATAWESDVGSDVEYGGRQAESVRIIGATEQYFEVRDWKIERGRAFSAQEVRAGIPVVVLGHQVAERLFEEVEPLGRDVKIRGIPYRVVGIVESQGNVFGFGTFKILKSQFILRPVSGACFVGARSPTPPPFPPPTPLPASGLCSPASSVLWRSPTSPARASSATAPRLPDADHG